MSCKSRYYDGLKDVALSVNPGWEVVEMCGPEIEAERWSDRWRLAGESVQWVGAHREKFIALKTSPIWKALGDGVGGFKGSLGKPWPPFYRGGGMNLLSVSSEQCRALNL